MQYSCDSILIRGLLTKFRSAYWNLVILGGCFGMWRTLWGVRDVWQSVTGGGGSKLVKNSVTYYGRPQKMVGDLKNKKVIRKDW